MEKYIDEISERILRTYVKWSLRRGHIPFSKQREQQLTLLHPELPGKKSIVLFYKQVVQNCLLTVLVFIGILTAYIVSKASVNTLNEGYTLERKAAGEGDYRVYLDATLDEKEYSNLEIDVGEKELADSEFEVRLSQFVEELSVVILAENKDLSHINSNMNLVSSLEGYPFYVRWESSDFAILQDNGELGIQEASADGCEVELRAVISYLDYEEDFEYKLIVYPRNLTEEEGIKKQLFQAINEQERISKTKDFMVLPDELDGKAIVWKETDSSDLYIIVVIMLALLAGIWIGNTKELDKRVKERNDELLSDYAQLVSKLQILLSSGLTIRGAFARIGDEYKKSGMREKKKRYMYEEILICNKKIGDGISERECYEEFGSRCNLQCYKKLASLLAQNLKKGNAGIIEALANEARMAFEERKNLARRKGEEAQTKLIFPMMLMLGVVMIMIMIPAYLSFGGM